MASQTLVIPMHDDLFTNVATTGAHVVLHRNRLVPLRYEDDLIAQEYGEGDDPAIVRCHLCNEPLDLCIDLFAFDSEGNVICIGAEECGRREATREILAGLSDCDDYEDAVSDGYNRWMSGEF